MKKVVTIGGGTGSYTVLSGLRTIPEISISALVSMADDGGSTGILRKELGVLPPGDVRQCLIALSEQSEVIKKLMGYRFETGSLAGHNFGNIFLASLEKVTGSFETGLKFATQFMQLEGAVLPITFDNAKLNGVLKSGETIEGESNLDRMNLKIGDVVKIFYKDKVIINPKAAKALYEADYIIICPGVFYSSILPNFIVEGFKETLAESKAKIIAIENLDNENTDMYISTLESYLGKSTDTVIGKDTSLMSREIVVQKPEDAIKRSTIRHDVEKLALRIKQIIEA